jgi:hypothetical protein
MAPFPLGRVVATPGALKILEETGEDPRLLLARHRSGDWGELDEHDRRENEWSLKYGWRILMLLSGRRAAHLDHHRGGQVRHYHLMPGTSFEEWVEAR